MKAKLVCYALEKTPQARRTLLHRELYGYTDFSNHGRYVYRREGLLQKIRGRRVTDAVILVAHEHAHKLLSVLKRYGAKAYVFDVLSRIRL